MIWYQASSVLKKMFPVLHFQTTCDPNSLGSAWCILSSSSFLFFFFLQATHLKLKNRSLKSESCNMQNSLQIQHSSKDFSLLTLSSRVEFDSLKWMTEINSVQNVFLTKKGGKKNSLTRRWLSLKPPGPNDWIRTFLEIFGMEKGFLSVNTKLKSPPDLNKSAAPRADFTRSHWLPTVFVCIFPLAAAVKEAIVPVNSYFVLYEGSKCSIKKLLGVNIFQAPWCWRRNGAPHQLMWHFKYCKHI